MVTPLHVRPYHTLIIFLEQHARTRRSMLFLTYPNLSYLILPLRDVDRYCTSLNQDTNCSKTCCHHAFDVLCNLATAYRKFSCLQRRYCQDLPKNEYWDSDILSFHTQLLDKQNQSYTRVQTFCASVGIKHYPLGGRSSWNIRVLYVIKMKDNVDLID